MARNPLRPDDIAAFRERATGVAMKLFAERGYDGVTMRALAGELGCSPMTPYRYIANKDELFVRVRARAYRRFGDRLEAALAAGGDLRARFRRLSKAYFGFALDEPDAYRIMFELRQPDPEDHPELAEQSRRAFSCLHRPVIEAVAAGQLTGDPLTIAHLLWARAHGLVSLHLAGKLRLGRSFEELMKVELTLPGPAREKP